MLLLFREIIDSDIVHIHDIFIWYFPYKIFFPFKKIYITFHGYENYPLKLKDFLIHVISEKLSKKNICIGKYITKWYKTKPSIVSYGAVDTKRFKAKKNKNINYDFIFIGRLDKQTGVDIYISAFNKLNIKNNYKLLVLGNDFGVKGQNSNIYYVGKKYNVEKYLNNSKYAFVSRYLSILESFSNKKLVFAVYDNPLKKDYLYMTPFSKMMVICNSPQNLVDKIKYYIAYPEKAKRIQKRAYLWVIDKTWDNLAEDYLNLWGNGV
jgi:glycosyltransferase involved in cell wall biosynthesis